MGLFFLLFYHPGKEDATRECEYTAIKPQKNHEFPFFTLAKGEKNCYSNKVKIIEKVSSCDGKIEALCADPLSDSGRRLCHFHDGGCIHYPVLIDFVPGPENIRAFLLSFLNVHWGIDKSTHRVYNKNTPHGGIVL